MLEVRNLVKSYRKNKVLKGVDLTVKDKEIKAIIGINGAGKSTLIEIICNVKNLDSGNILVAGMDIKDKKNRNELKCIVGYMPQHFNLYLDLTVEENLKYLCSVYRIESNKAIDVMKFCKLDDKARVLAKNLSGGYKQLLSFACAIVHSPKFLILDEPTSAMDPLFRKFFWDNIKKCNQNGVTILLITHHIEELLECDSFACLANGVITFDGDVEDFKKEGFINIESVLEKYKREGRNEES